MASSRVLKMFMRNRWRTSLLALSSLVVVLLVLSPSVTIRAMQSHAISEALEGVPYHFSIWVGIGLNSSGEIRKSVEGLSFVDKTEVIYYSYLEHYYLSDSGFGLYRPTLLYLENSSLLEKIGVQLVAGRFPEGGEIALYRSMSDRVHVGDVLRLKSGEQDVAVFTVSGFYEFSEQGLPGGFLRLFPPDLVGQISLPPFISGSKSPLERGSQGLVILVYVRKSSLSLYDIDYALKRISEMEDDLRQAVVGALGAGARIYITSPLEESLSSASEEYRARMILLSMEAIPFVVVGWYFGVVAAETTLGGAEKYLASMASRGVPLGRVKRGYMAFVLTASLVGALVGVPLALAISYPIVRLLYGFGEFGLPGLYDSIVAVVLALVTALVIYWRTRKSLGGKSVARAMREFEPGAENPPGAGKLAWTLFILGSLKLAEWISGVTPMDLLRHVGRNAILTIIIVIWLILSEFLQIFAPFFFIFGAARIFSSYRKVLGAFSKAFTRLFGGGDWPLANSYGRRLPRTHSRNALITALIIALIIISLGFFGSISDYQDRFNKFYYGSELSYQVSDVNFTDLEGSINSLAPAGYLILQYQDVGTMVIENCSFYGKSVQLWYLIEGDPSILYWGNRDKVAATGRDPVDVLNALGGGDGILVAGGDFERARACVGHMGNISFHLVEKSVHYVPPGAEDEWISFRIDDVFRAFPGLVKYSLGEDIVVMRGEPSDQGYFLVFMTGVDQEKADQLFSSMGGERLQAPGRSSMVNETAKWLRVFGIFGSAIAFMTVALLSISAIRRRLFDIGVIRSRGFTPLRASRLAFSMVIPGIMLGTILGLATGLISEFGLLNTVTSTLGTVAGLGEVIPVHLRLAAQDAALLLGTLAGFLVIPFLASLEASKEKLIGELRGV